MTKATVLKDAILVHGDAVQDLTERVVELKQECEAVKRDFEAEKSLTRRLRTETNALENIKNKYKTDIKDEIIKKFRIESTWKFLDDMEMTIINYLIIQAKSNVVKTNERYNKELQLFKVSICYIITDVSMFVIIMYY